MNFNEETYTNLKFLISKKKIDVAIKDINGCTALHYLAMNNVHQLCIDQVYERKVDDDEDEDTSQPYTRYVKRRGKFIKKTVKPRRRRYLN